MGKDKNTARKQIKIIPNDERVSWKEIDKEIVILDRQERKFYELNKSGSIIWKEIVRRGSAHSALKRLQHTYRNVSEEKLSRDINVFVENLLQKGFLLNK